MSWLSPNNLSSTHADILYQKGEPHCKQNVRETSVSSDLAKGLRLMQIFLAWKTEECCRCEERFCEEEIGQADTLTLRQVLYLMRTQKKQVKTFFRKWSRKRIQKKINFLKHLVQRAYICLFVSLCVHARTSVCTYMCTCVFVHAYRKHHWLII